MDCLLSLEPIHRCTKSGSTSTEAMGTIHAIVAMARGPAPMTDKTAVMIGMPKITSKLTRLLLLNWLMYLVADSPICPKSTFSLIIAAKAAIVSLLAMSTVSGNDAAITGSSVDNSSSMKPLSTVNLLSLASGTYGLNVGLYGTDVAAASGN